MAELLVVGSLVFWLSMIAWVVILWALTENEYGFCGLLSCVIYGCILQFGFKLDVYNWILSHPIPIVIFAAFYFFIGAAWSFFRWFLYVKDKLEPYTLLRTDWLVSKGQTVFNKVPDALKEEWAKYINDWSRKDACKVPLVRDYKTKIMNWIGYWPISALSWAFNDMIRRFVKMIYNAIHDYLQNIANRVFAVIKRDLPDDGVTRNQINQ